MNAMLLDVLLVPVAWLVGTFPSATLVARAHGREITREGSGNPGASNVQRVLGWKAGLFVFLIDFAKGAAMAGLGLWVGGRAGAFALGGAAILGHVFPIYRKGGKGVATGAGVLIVLYPVMVLVGLALWLLIARVLHKASLASLLTAIAFPVAALLLCYDLWEVGLLCVLAALIVLRHSGNIKRLLRREEIDLGKG
jgi:glycerol-3-phosphate acyltransferase PlsY